jgi:hypothetical protein
MTQTIHPRRVRDERTTARDALAEAQTRPGDGGRVRWWWVAGAVVVASDYALALASVQHHDAGAVALDVGPRGAAEAAVTLHVEAVDLDTGAGRFDFTLRPVVGEGLRAADGTGLAEPMRVEVTSADLPPEVFEFPAGQIVDPVAVSVVASQGATAFPFDRPRTGFGLDVVTGGERVPAALEINDQTAQWRLGGDARTTGDRLVVDLQARRETLAIGLALFYVISIVVVGLITVLVVGGSVLRRQVAFGEIIWLGAMLVAIPSVRNQMPGVPPIGTVADLFVFFPAIVIVGVALISAVVVTAQARARESAAAAGGRDASSIEAEASAASAAESPVGATEGGPG